MGLIGREIIQTRTYVDPNNPDPPKLNYKESFPISVFDAIRQDMDDENSMTLTEALEKIGLSLQGKQPLFPAKSANYLMTYAGVPGAVGAVQMSMNIPWDPNQQSNSKIPTEKAVGDLIQKLGLVDEEGNLISPNDAKVRWSDVIGRPLLYEELGTNSDGFITQKGVTTAVNSLKTEFNTLSEDVTTKTSSLISALTSHVNNKENPHAVSIDQIGAASAEVLSDHMNDYDNPHKTTAAQVGLDKVDNTSDLDKPVSNATQVELDKLSNLLNILQDDSLGFLTNIEYDQPSGIFKFWYNNGSYVTFNIPIDGLVDEIRYDTETKEVVIIELGGHEKRMDLSDLFIRYIGSLSSNIEVEIVGTQETGEQIIKATIIPQSVTDNELADDAVVTRTIKDQAVTTDKIGDKNVTTDKLADESVATKKVSSQAITNEKIASRAVNGRTLFASNAANRVLVVGDASTDPYYGQINNEMISSNAVENKHLSNDSVSADKIADKSVITSKLDDLAVTTAKLGDLSVTNPKLADNSVDGRVIKDNVAFNGTPTISKRPSSDSDGNEIPDTRWVSEHVRNYVNTNSNYGDRTVDGRVLFTSPVRHRVLGVLGANTNPVWTQVDNDMVADDAINTRTILDRSVTKDKIATKSIYNEHMTDSSVSTDNIQTSAVTSDKLFTSDNANMVLAAVAEKGHPIYTQIQREMIAANAIGGDTIEDRSIRLSKLESSDQPNRILGVALKQTNAQWMQVTTGMIEDSAVTLAKLNTVPFQDVVLGSLVTGDHPLWTKINERMIEEGAIRREHIGESEVWGEHIHEKSIESKHILDWSITSNNIAPGAITGTELFTSPYPNRVLAVTSMPFSKPDWLQVTTDMIEDKAISKEKLFQSTHPYRVLGTTQAGVPPEYIMITHDFIVDDSITPAKLTHNFVLYGTPELTLDPDPDADNRQLASTQWVRQTILTMSKDFDTLYGTVTTGMIADRAVTGPKLFTSTYEGPRVLGVTKAGDDPEYIRIEEDLIVDGAVTTNKLQRDIHLLGSPMVEIRPSPTATDSSGEGHLIPDCQWVLDRIAEGGGGTGTGGTVTTTATPPDNSVTSAKIQNRAVTGDKLFTTSTANRVLGVTASNASPAYVQVNEQMIATGAVSARTIWKSTTANMVMATTTAGSDPVWSKIKLGMMDNNSVGTDQLVNLSVTTKKIANKSITNEKLADEALISETQIQDLAVTTGKIRDSAVETDKIADEAVTSEKLDSDLVLKGHPTVEPDMDYETRSIRNTILSPNAPRGGSPGDIWIRYV